MVGPSRATHASTSQVDEVELEARVMAVLNVRGVQVLKKHALGKLATAYPTYHQLYGERSECVGTIAINQTGVETLINVTGSISMGRAEGTSKRDTADYPCSLLSLSP